MNFGQMIDELKDHLGITGTIQNATRNRLDRVMNHAKDRFVGAYKWHWLETSGAQLFTQSTRNYQVTTACAEIISLEGPDGSQIRKVERETYDRLHRPSTATASVPTAYSVQGWQSSLAQSIHVYPNPTTNTAGTIRYVPKIANLTSVSDGSTYSFIPDRAHYAMVQAAVAEFYRLEGRPELAGAHEQVFQSELGQLAGGVEMPVQKSGAEQ